MKTNTNAKSENKSPNSYQPASVAELLLTAECRLAVWSHHLPDGPRKAAEELVAVLHEWQLRAGKLAEDRATLLEACKAAQFHLGGNVTSSISDARGILADAIARAAGR